MAPKENDNKKPKEISSVNQRPNPSAAGRKRKAQAGPPLDGRNPKQPKPLTPEEQQAQKALQAQQAKLNAENDLRQWLNSPRGQDYPGGLVKQWLKPRGARLVIRPEPTTEDPEPVPYIVSGLKVRLCIQSNTPALRLFKGGKVFHIRSENIKGPADQCRTIFSDAVYDADFASKTLVKAFKAQQWTPGLSEEDAADLTQFGLHEDDKNKEADQKVGGIRCMSFRTKGDFWLDQTSNDPKSKDLEQLVKALDKRDHVVTVVWLKRDIKEAVHSYWVLRTEKCILEGVWNYYKDVIGTIEGQLLNAWEKNPNKEIKHQIWMEIQVLKKAKGEVKKFASQALKRSFGSMRELEITECIALIYETMYENQVIRKYFDMDKYHQATVKQAVNGYVQLEVKVQKQDDYAMPPVTEDSRFTVRKVQVNDPDLDMHDAGAFDDEPEGDEMFPPEKEQPTEKPAPTFTHSGNEYKGRTINVDSDADFVVSFFVQKKEERAEFVEGQQITVALKMDRNPIPTRRQLKEVMKDCKKPSKKDGWKFRAMQRFLKGAGNPETDSETLGSLKEEAFARMDDREKKLFQDYIDSCNMNGPQQDVWKHIFDYRHFLTMLQGPPGTGKTRTVANIALSYALLKMKTALCAPSNTATEECMRNVVQNLNRLCEIDPEAKNDFKVVLLPTTASTKASLANLGEEQAAYDFLAEGEGAANDPFQEYRLHAHVVKSFQTRVATGQGDVEQARKWLSVRDKLKSRNTVSRKELRAFIDLGIEEGGVVLKDPRVRLVVSTSNNADQMAEYGYKPQAVVIDEAAFATEQDSMVPLSLGARSNVIVGDHEQLKPIVRSRGSNEFASQLGLSLYERFYGHFSVPLFRLKINYRMHPDIAELPGILTYEWLGCDPCTSIPSDAYNYFNEWYQSEAGESYREATRAPAFGGVADESNRVRWLNTIGGKASPKPGSTSLRNFANINAAVDLVTSLLNHQPSDDVPDLPGSSITIISPYKDDLDEMKKQLKMAIDLEMPRFLNVPEGSTVDKMQGGQNEIIILLIPPHHCSLLDFLKEWNRWNVALTRAKSVLWIVGPLDGLRAQLKVLSKGMRCKKLALTIIDYLEKGRVVDIAGSDRLPVSLEESKLPRQQWSQVQNDPLPQDLKLKDSHQKIQKSYDATEQARFELELLKELKSLRAKSVELRARFERGEQFDLPLKTRLGDEGDDEDMNDDDEDFVEHADEEEGEAEGGKSSSSAAAPVDKDKGKQFDAEPTASDDASHGHEATVEEVDPYLQSQIDEDTRRSRQEEYDMREAIKRSKAELALRNRVGESSHTQAGPGRAGDGEGNTEMPGVPEAPAQVESGGPGGEDLEMEDGQAAPRVRLPATETREPNDFSADLLQSLEQSTEVNDEQAEYERHLNRIVGLGDDDSGDEREFEKLASDDEDNLDRILSETEARES
jgi:hypothetical protein